MHDIEEKLVATRKEVELNTLEAQLWEDDEKASVSPATFTTSACVTDDANDPGDQQRKEVHFTGVPGRTSTPVATLGRQLGYPGLLGRYLSWINRIYLCRVLYGLV